MWSERWFLTGIYSYRPAFSALTKMCLPWIAFGLLAHGQVLNQDQEVEVHDLPALMARSPHSSDALLTSLDTVFHDKDICCGRDSALGDGSLAADPRSLKDVASKLDGRHLLSDGRPIKVTAKYLTVDQVNSGNLITSILNQHALLMEWNSHVYVVHGVVYRWVALGGGPDGGYTQGTLIHKILLWDTRYSGSRREVVFDRTSEDLSKVQGLLFLEVAPD
jgi:hypothetical protein